jgi:hypothetical protein
MLTVTRAAHRMALAHRDRPPRATDVQPGDWESVESTQTPEQAEQYLTLYESLQGFDERAALDHLHLARLVFAGADDSINYGPQWGDAYVGIADAVRTHRDELTGRGWAVQLIPGADHLGAMQARRVLPILVPWLRQHWR